ncbi:cytochrome C oxidase subunit IV family protein [Desmospora profundinema]|uniref:Heme/copper-type cytochrome/quinol oxidase subunit 4 n=1 Tax=Desmospora profundinema TaxID=1571184 RepID=A0ABU1IPG0_9BACL|nr:cytochrome C oxidase subunit IV family protein [Desmospora profundinema]MDR6226044.1 heme/copper-type cytochrome/quinol oxidase subunit 4 [Desmospora profundinema]
MAQLEKPQTQRTVQGRSSAGAYVLSFLWMILLTGIAFFLVVTEWLSQEWTITVILLLAVWQVVLQLASFMHLREKGNGVTVLFIAMGGIVSATVIVALVFL